MTTFNKLGTDFADLADRVKKEAELTDAGKAEIIKFIDDWEAKTNEILNAAMTTLREMQAHITKSTSELSDAVSFGLTARSTALMETVGEAPETTTKETTQ